MASRVFGWLVFVALLVAASCSTAHAQVATLYGSVNDESAALVVSQIQAANEQDTKEPIFLFIDSGGGSLTAGLKILDAMAVSRRPVWTVNVQMAASMAAIVFSYGAKRGMFPHAMLMFHNEKGRADGSTEQILAEVGAFARVIRPIQAHLAKQAGISVETLKERLSAGWWMVGREAVKANMATEVINLESYPVPKAMHGQHE